MERDNRKSKGKEEEMELLEKATPVSKSRNTSKKESKGPDNTVFYVACGLILIPGVLFCVFVAPILWSKYSPVPVLGFLYILVSDLAWLWLTHSTDPGIIPKHSAGPESNEASSNRDRYYDNGETPPREITINGMLVKQRFCQTCNIWRPPRASHCNDCNHCVENFDHHCPWVGNCVAKRNYRFFLLFLLMTTLLCIYAFACSFGTLYLLALESNPDSSSVAYDVAMRSPISVVICIYTFILVWSVGGLGCFHTYLVSTGQSTHEEFTARKNPFFFGAWNNWINTCCPPALPSYTRNNAACLV
jgi:palmitoyltransferase ZDHHC9/14/18